MNKQKKLLCSPLLQLPAASQTPKHKRDGFHRLHCLLSARPHQGLNPWFMERKEQCLLAVDLTPSTHKTPRQAEPPPFLSLMFGLRWIRCQASQTHRIGQENSADCLNMRPFREPSKPQRAGEAEQQESCRNEAGEVQQDKNLARFGWQRRLGVKQGFLCSLEVLEVFLADTEFWFFTEVLSAHSIFEIQQILWKIIRFFDRGTESESNRKWKRYIFSRYRSKL